MAIRYDPKFNKEINNIIKNYNAKITRLLKSGKENVYVPKKFDRKALQELKQKSNTRKDIRRRLNELKKYSSRGGEVLIKRNNVSIPKILYNQAISYNRVLTRKINRTLKKYKTKKPTTLGVEDDFTFAELREREFMNALAKRDKLISSKNLEDLSIKELEDYLEYQRSNLRSTNLTRWHNQYLEILTETAYAYGVPHRIVHRIREVLDKLTPEQFNDLLTTERTLQQIIYYYKALTDIGVDLSYENMGDDVSELFEELYNHLDDITSEYN